MRDIQEFSTKEVAETLGLSVNLTKTRLHRARMRLRKHFIALEKVNGEQIHHPGSTDEQAPQSC